MDYIVYSANSYNIRYIGEILFQLLAQALKYYPCNVPWLRLMGDLNFGKFLCRDVSNVRFNTCTYTCIQKSNAV